MVAACNGTETTCPQGLLGALSSADTTKDIVLQIERKGKPMTITVKPGSIGAK